MSNTYRAYRDGDRRDGTCSSATAQFRGRNSAPCPPEHEARMHPLQAFDRTPRTTVEPLYNSCKDESRSRKDFFDDLRAVGRILRHRFARTIDARHKPASIQIWKE